MTVTPSLSVIVPTLGASRWLVPCLEALRQDGGPELEILLVSQSGFRDPRAEELADEVLRSEDNLGFAGANNLGFAAARGEWLGTVNDDAVVDPGWSRRLLAAVANRPEVASAQGVNLALGDPPVIDGAGLAWNRSWQAVQIAHGESPDTLPRATAEVFGVSATAAIYRRSALEAVAGQSLAAFESLAAFDSRFFAYYEDVDLACRLRGEGFRALRVPRATARHAGSASGARVRGGKLRLIYRNRHLTLARLLGRVYWSQWPGIVLRDAADLAGAVRRGDARAASSIVLGLLSALPAVWSFAHLGGPRVPLVTLRRLGIPPRDPQADPRADRRDVSRDA